ncbi:MAG: hypothetical protein KGZ45_05420 [Clostridium sp.]|nr:hypothetical protein [Clostridium sp.]MCL4464028.1 hypothetical protein [Bacillota bacterium]
MTDRELLELIASQVGVLTKDMTEVKGRLAGVENHLTGVEDRLTGVEDRLTGVEDRLTGVEGAVVKIEIDHGQKLGALFDGQKLNSEKLDRIEAEVTKHGEVILRRIR